MSPPAPTRPPGQPHISPHRCPHELSKHSPARPWQETQAADHSTGSPGAQRSQPSELAYKEPCALVAKDTGSSCRTLECHHGRQCRTTCCGHKLQLSFSLAAITHYDPLDSRARGQDTALVSPRASKNHPARGGHRGKRDNSPAGRTQHELSRSGRPVPAGPGTQQVVSRVC